MKIRFQDVEYYLSAQFDGDFWFVEVHERMGSGDRLRYEYKLNEPDDADSACKRAWEIFKNRYLSQG